MDSQSIVQRIAVYALPLLFALTVREIVRGHVALRLGDTTGRELGRLSLNPLNHVDPIGTLLLPVMMLVISGSGFGGFLIGWPKIIPIDYRRLHKPQRDIGLIAASGLAANLAMAIAWAILLRVTYSYDATGEGVWAGFKAMATAGVFLNASFFVLNLLPLPPFDFGRVLVSVLPPRRAQGLLQLEPYAFLILIILAITGILQAVLIPPLSLLVGLVLWLVGVAPGAL